MRKSFAVILFWVSLLCQAATDIDGVRVRPSPEATRVVFDLDNHVEHSIFALENPDRLVVDIQSAVMHVKLESLDLRGTPIASIRSGPRGKDDLRIVLDLTEKVRPRSFSLRPIKQYGDRLVIDLYPVQSDRPTPAPKIATDGPGQRDLIIAIDAGHGGDDPGALGPRGLQEKNVVLAIARRLSEMFADEPGYKPLMIRDGDYYVGLRRRTAIARENQADLILSIHADAFKTHHAHGASVYAISERGATSETARWLADNENRADLIGGVEVVSLDDKDELLAKVLLDLSMTASLETSLRVGESVLSSLGAVTRLHKRRVEQAGFAVLKSPDIPSILIETGYISNPEEAKALASSKYREMLARAIFNGVRGYFERHPTPGTRLASRSRAPQAVTQHVIRRGDTISTIAEQYSVSIEKLRSVNSLSGDVIRIGQILRIPLS